MNTKILTVLLIGMMLIPLAGVSAGSVDENTFIQDYTFYINLDKNGDANITLITVWEGPRDKIHELIEKLLNQTNGSIANATKLYANQILQSYIQALGQSGLETDNQSVEVKGLREGNNITVIFRAKAKGVAKYYSHGDFWEVLIDPTRGYAHIATPDTGYPYRIILHNKFIIELPPNATLLSYPIGYRRTYNQSSFEVTPKLEGNEVIVESEINIEPYLKIEGYQWLFGDYKGFSITYQTPYKGEENYARSVLRESVTVEVLKNGTTVLTMRDEYIEPHSRILAQKIQIMQYGVRNFEQALLKNYVQMFKEMGADVLGAGVNIKDVNTTGPLVVEARFILNNYTKLENGTYVLHLNPTMGLVSRVYLRSNAEFNYTFSAEVKLPDGWEFVSYPNSTSRDIHGNIFKMDVRRDGNKLIINASTYVYYGATDEDVQHLLEKFSSVDIKFKPGEESGWKICGPGAILGIIVLLGIFLRKH